MKPMMLNVISSAIILAGNGTVMASDSVRLVATLQGEMPGDHLGGSMAGVGDVDGDGLADFLVGDSRDGWHPGERRCHLFFGKPHLSSVPDVVLEQPEVYSYEGRIYDDMFGAVVDGGKDINGDGLDDFVITSPEWFWATGKVYLYHGGSFPPDECPAIGIAGFGSSWMTLFWATQLRGVLVADVNMDGYGELACLVGEATRDVGAYVYFGGAPMDSVHDLGLQGEPDFSVILGASLASGDLNGDDYDDIVVGAYANFPHSDDAAWVFWGGPDPACSPGLRLKGGHDCDIFYRVCIPGDMNGDGYDDLVVGDSGGHPPWYRIYLGGEPMDSVPAVVWRGQVTGTVSLAGGDLNNDGFADLIAVEESHPGGTCVATVLVFFGGTALDSIPDVTYEVTFLAEDSGDLGLVWIGDATGDGYAEFALANPGFGGWARPRGEIYIYTMGPVSAVPSEVARALTVRIAPNPAAGQAVVSFSVSRSERIRLGAYDPGGRRAGLLCDGLFTKGSHSIHWDTRGLSSGVYLIRLETETGTDSRRVVVGR
ncbi:FG-GAP repeat protein [Candidatus Fermentibacteria bacterium]|nr:FG-GAP repeat protein [Candidatus Fermentibacteria bacterium]